MDADVDVPTPMAGLQTFVFKQSPVVPQHLCPFKFHNPFKKYFEVIIRHFLHFKHFFRTVFPLLVTCCFFPKHSATQSRTAWQNGPALIQRKLFSEVYRQAIFLLAGTSYIFRTASAVQLYFASYAIVVIPNDTGCCCLQAFTK